MRKNLIKNPCYAIGAILTILASPLLITGCQKPTPSDGSTSQNQMTNRLDKIAKTSGGDWDKVSPEDKDYLVKDLSHGDERSARMLLQAKSGHAPHRERPSGPPRAGHI